MKEAIDPDTDPEWSRSALLFFNGNHAKPMIGKTYAHYEVLEKLGQGGMGVVYKARDQRLGRLVALKMLPGSLLENRERKLRFLQEARAASALSHPNIVTIYEIQLDPEPSFIAMEYVEGKTLDAWISGRLLDIHGSLMIALQVADALAAAHAGGILHRDLKPANIMLHDVAHVKLLDFGLAKRTFAELAAESALTVSIPAAPLTAPGTVLGTVSYMSPEQAEGNDLDGRSDMFSFGAVLYEMVTGHRAFQGSSNVSILSSILRDQPRPVRELAPGVPPELEVIVARCLEKKQERRFADMAEVKSALEAMTCDLSISGRRMAISMPVSPSAPERGPSIAVLPFANMSPDRENDYFSDGLAEEILTALSQVEGLQVTARTSAFAFRGRDQDIRAIGEMLNVRTLLEGSVRRAGNRIRVTAQLISAADGYHLWSERYDRELTDVFAIQEEIARAIVERLRVRLALTPGRPLVRRHTTDLEAYDLYLRGQYHAHGFTPESLARSKAYFELAIERDPNYALAYAGLSYYYGALGWFGFQPPRLVIPASLEMARRALDLDSSLAEAHMLLGLSRIIGDFDWAEGERCLKRALELKPSSPLVAENYAIHFLMPRGRIEEALVRLNEALQCDPLSLPLLIDTAWALAMSREFTHSLEIYRKALKIDPSHFLVYWGIVINYLQMGMHKEAIAACEEAGDIGSGIPMTLGVLGSAYAAVGRTEDALKVLQELLRKSEAGYVPAASVATIYLGLLDLDKTFEWLGKAVEGREGPVLLLNVNPIYDVLRPDPRFAGLLRKMRLG